MLTRRNDWMQRLIEAVQDAKLLTFRYGVHDCCLWAAHCVDRMCDTGFTREIQDRFNYTDEASANAVIDAGGGLVELVTSFLGVPVRAAFAAPGDVVIVRNGEQSLVGVVVGHSIIAPSADGLITLPFADGIICWKV